MHANEERQQQQNSYVLASSSSSGGSYRWPSSKIDDQDKQIAEQKSRIDAQDRRCLELKMRNARVKNVRKSKRLQKTLGKEPSPPVKASKEPTYRSPRQSSYYVEPEQSSSQRVSPRKDLTPYDVAFRSLVLLQSAFEEGYSIC